MNKVEAVRSPDAKSDICNAVLRALPSWFGNETAIIGYVNDVRQMPFYAAYHNETAVGFVAIKLHNEHTAEVCVMGVLCDYHGQGIGRQLIEACEAYCASTQRTFLTAKTLDASAAYAPYDGTRSFYTKMGFIPLEVFPLHWDAENPCLFLAKYIGSHHSKEDKEYLCNGNG